MDFKQSEETGLNLSHKMFAVFANTVIEMLVIAKDGNASRPLWTSAGLQCVSHAWERKFVCYLFYT